MKAIRALLGQGWLIGLLVVLLLALLIWFGGPYVSFGEAQPFASLVGRLIALLVLIAGWALWAQFSAWRAQRRGAALAGSAAGAGEQAAQSGAASSPAEAAGLQDRFARAIAALRKSGRARNLYDLPWYVIIGAPGSGKTTALLNASLQFPLEQEFGRDPLKGVGGTRNCDWWITDSAILLDTAGRYTTQDSDAGADRGGWHAFLGLLRKHRRRRPINGVLLALSVADLVSQDEAERQRHVRAIRQRLEELHRELRISFPVYVLFTKVDLLAGFTEHFDDLNLAGRAQVWGMTFPLDASQRGGAAELFGREFDLLAGRLQERIASRLAEERDLGRRAAAFAFQGQFAGIRPLLQQTVDGIFRGADHAGQVWLRGCYFTSGTQEGTPVDRMLGALSRTFGLSARAQPVAAGSGKSYFLDHLLRQVVFQESGLAGVNRARQLREAGLSIAAYALVGLVTVLGVIAMVTSYRANRAYLAEVQTLAGQLLSGPAVSDASGGIEAVLPRLDALRLVVDAARQHTDSRPMHMGFGLYQGRAIGNAAGDGYRRALNATLGPWASEHFAGRLREAAAEPDRLYEYLRAYLMLGEPKRIEPAQLAQIGSAEWARRFAGNDATAQSVANHFEAWVSAPDRIVPAPIDQTLVLQARTALAQASVPLLMYSRMRLAQAGETEGQIHLDRELSLGADALFVRRSGAPLSQPLPALYTKAAFDSFNRTGRVALLQQFLDDGWVLGDQAPRITDSPRLVSDVTALYEQDYIRAWEGVMDDLALRPIRDERDALGVLESLTSATSPLKNLLVLVERQTNLTRPADPQAAPPNPALGAANALGAQIDRALGASNAAKPGTLVTTRFAPLHKLVEGPPGGAPIDGLLAQLKQPLQQLRGAAGGAGGAAAVAQALDMMKVVAGQLPAPVSAVVGQAVSQSGQFALGGARTELGNRYRNEVVANCQDLIGNRYPFDRNSAVDVAMADFASVFAPGGVYDRFFQSQLAQFVDTSTATWRWKEETRDIAAVPLKPFQDAERIRQAFFGPGGGTPSMPFTLTPDTLDTDVNRFVLTIDGQTLEYSFGQRKATRINWPSATPSGASYVFEERAGGRPNRSFTGVWAAFRLVESGQLDKQSDTRYLLTLTGGQSTARLVLTLDSVRNPFARPELLRFRCGG